MISVHAPGRLVAGSLLAALVGLVGTTPAVAERPAPPRTTIDPGALPAGAAPAIPYLDDRAATMVLPDGRTISTERFGRQGRGPDSELLHARNGYLMADKHGAVALVRESGRIRVVTRSTEGLDAPLSGAVVSADGRWLVVREIVGQAIPRRAVTLRTIRISDGRVLDQQVFRAVERLGVMAAGEGRVLIGRTIKQGKTRWADTLVWDPARGKVRRLDRRRSGTWVETVASTAAHRFVAAVGDRQLVRDTRTRRGLWRLPADDRVVSFSPDDERVVTLAGVSDDVEDPWHTGETASTVKVRNARTGALISAFTGAFSTGGRTTNPVWESPTSILLHATGKPYWSEEREGFVYPDPSVVRCGVVSARCVRVPVSAFETKFVVRKSN